LLEDLLIWL